MNKANIQIMQRELGLEPDGFWGPKSISACQAHLRSLIPTPNPWPRATTADMTQFYGYPGIEANLVMIDAPHGFSYDGRPVPVMRCHRKVADSLLRILPQVLPLVSAYDGIYNLRKMRGGIRHSMHAWGAAIDLDAGNNSNRAAWPAVATMPLEVMRIFAREGWLSAGAFWGRDAMHFQATR